MPTPDAGWFTNLATMGLYNAASTAYDATASGLDTVSELADTAAARVDAGLDTVSELADTAAARVDAGIWPDVGWADVPRFDADFTEETEDIRQATEDIRQAAEAMARAGVAITAIVAATYIWSR